MKRKKINWWESDHAHLYKPKEGYKIVSQESLFPDLIINEKIIIKDDSKKETDETKEKEERAENILDENKEEGKKAKIKIIHRKNFGIIEKNIYENLDRKDGDRNEKCVYKCRKGTLWVYYGYEFSRMAIIDNVLKIHRGFPDSLYDVLNEAEIYQLFVALYKGKWNRDYDPKYPAYEIGYRDAYAAQLISHENIEKTDIPTLVAELIKQGEYYLRNHWYYENIIADKNSNPYPTSYESLKERLSIVPEDDKNLIRKILKVKKPYLSTKSNGYLPGIDIYRIAQSWKKREDGTHIRKKELPKDLQEKIGFFVNPWMCADLIFDYMKRREQNWKKWDENIEVS
ncbi:MAG: hypothetical protein QXK21_01930 [Candidatus Micrarchaeia archaeon]